MKLRYLAAVAALAAPAAHAVDDAAFARCRSIVDTAARLACYDALAIAPRAPMAAPGAAPSRPSAAPPAASTAAPAASARAPSAPAPAPPANAVAAATAPENFGMEERVVASGLAPTMESTIPGHFEGWSPGSRIKLANGQVWQVVDQSSAFFNRDNPKVVVRRGMMGGFFLEIEDSNRSPRVRRIQ
jgi:hypothetical protein